MLVDQSNYQWRQATEQNTLANRLADDVIAAIAQAIEHTGMASIALSGGSTPKPFFNALANADFDWRQVVVTLVDERWVPISHALSNAAFLEQHFLSQLTIKPVFVPLYMPAESVAASVPSVLHQYCEATRSTIESPRSFDVVVLGMGNDGHTASFFPDADNIAELVDPSSAVNLLTCNSPTTQVARITWSVPRLLDTSLLALHITGETKKAVFEQAVQSNDAIELPIRSAIFQEKSTLQVYYCD